MRKPTVRKDLLRPETSRKQVPRTLDIAEKLREVNKKI